MLKRPLWVVTAVAVALGLSACSGGSVKSTAKPTPSSTTSSPSPKVSESSKTQPTAPVRAQRTVVEIKSALLALKDLPSGYSIEPISGVEDNGPVVSSKDPKCAAFVKLSNSKDAPGSKGSASRSFSAGQSGPFLDESIDAMGSPRAVEALQASFKSAVASCPQVRVTVPAQGTSTMQVVEVSAPRFGEHTFAARMTAKGGTLDGLEITQVVAGVKDVVVSVSFVIATPQDVDGGTSAAVRKATQVLDKSGSGT